MKKKFIKIVLTSYVVITLLLYILELSLGFGHPFLVIGQAFFVCGLLSISNSTIGYLFTMVGLYMVLSSLNIFEIDMFYFRYIIVSFFPFVPIFVLFSGWNDKQRIRRKGGIEVEATYIGTDSYGWPKFEYYINNTKYKGVLYKRAEYNYHKNERVRIYVSTENPQKIFVPFPKEETKAIKRIAIFLSIFALFCILLMLSEDIQ